MAPMAGVGGKDARLAERAAQRVYGLLDFFFSSQGLRRFKEKFDPEWEPRYLPFEAGTAIFQTVFSVTRAMESPRLSLPPETEA